MHRIDVAFLPSTPWSGEAGGLYRAVEDLTRGLNSRDEVRVNILAVADTTERRSPAQNGYTSINMLLGPRRTCYSNSLRDSLRSASFDMLHLHGLWTYPTLAALEWNRRTTKPFLISTHGMLDKWALRQSRFAKWFATALFQGRAFRKASCIHALSLAEASAIRDFGIREPIAVIPNAVALPHPDQQYLQRDAEARRTFLFLGRIVRKKGVSELVQAWRLIQESAMGQQWRLLLAGWIAPEFLTELRALLHRLRIEETVEFTGPVRGREKHDLLLRTDALVLPSHSEGQPMAVLEAWAYGIPTVITNECNLPEGFHAGAAIQCCPQAQSIATALLRVMRMPAPELSDMGLRGRELVRREFSWPIILDRYVSLYQWLIHDVPCPTWIRVN